MAKGKCLHCQRIIGIRGNGSLWKHLTIDGFKCEGSNGDAYQYPFAGKGQCPKAQPDD